MSETPEPPNVKRLQIIRLCALMDGAMVFALAYFLINGFAGFEWVEALISFALACITYGAVFYFGCLIFAPNLKDYIVSDDTKISGSNVEMVTTTRASGDETLDKWVASFTFARNLFGMGVVPVLILGGLFLFG